MKILARLLRGYYTAAHYPEVLAPLFELGLRLMLASVFFKSGLSKIKNWDSTLYLFSDVYQVPLLNSELAAYLASGAELALPVLLVLGLLTRFAAAGLFVVNAVAVLSYYHELSEAGINQHIYWALLLAVMLILNTGRWTLDALLHKQLN